jgi:hypothetical protein
MNFEKTSSENSFALYPAPHSGNNSLMVQPKLSIGAVNDPLEHEADAMADKVMRMPEQNFVQRKCAHCEEEERAQRKPIESFIQKKCAHCEEEEKAQRKPLASFIQKKQSSINNSVVVSDSVSNQIQSTKGGGNVMPGTTKTFMESRFGADFSNVKIHTGSYATQLSKDLNAQAFTVGNNIYFNEGKYSPESFTGKHLLAHELAHTLQQENSQQIHRSCTDGKCDECAGGKKELWLTAYFRNRVTKKTMKNLRAEVKEAKGVLAKCCIDLKVNYNWDKIKGSGNFDPGKSRPASDKKGAWDYTDEAETLGEGDTFNSSKGIPMLVVDSVPGTGGGVTVISNPAVDADYTGKTYIVIAVNQADENTTHSQIAHELWHVAGSFSHNVSHGGIASGTSDVVSDEYCTNVRGLV